MTDTDTDLAGHVDGHDAHADQHRHEEPSDRKYIWIAIILAVLTALEILSTEIGPQGSLLVPMLLVLMFIKFWIVASFFMHLRFDSRLFSFLFYLGLGFAVVLYSVVLATFHFWTG
ncbi:MAG TPA: cytochrome C oxidase subunit IV family protein [Ilumatobacteraceae bacterium]|nr:cytochrome C oxidase subunit IV family protein [Ilumatobacteraceae bacterium]